MKNLLDRLIFNKKGVEKVSDSIFFRANPNIPIGVYVRTQVRIQHQFMFINELKFAYKTLGENSV